MEKLISFLMSHFLRLTNSRLQSNDKPLAVRARQ